MRSKHVSELLDDLGVSKTHSRPYTSSDNPYSEANFKTLKYRPGFPARFDSIEHARGHCRAFAHWYNHQHRHSGIALMTPAAVHYGHADQLHAARARVLPGLNRSSQRGGVIDVIVTPGGLAPTSLGACRVAYEWCESA